MTSIDAALRRKDGRRRSSAYRLRHVGFEEASPLTLQAMEGELPRGRELSFSWLTGTVMTGLTSVLLMAAALYVSFDGKDTYSTAGKALSLTRADEPAATASKGNRLRPTARIRSSVEVLQASIGELEDGKVYLRNQQFTRLDATLAISATAMTEDIPVFDPAALAASLDNSSAQAGGTMSPQLYAANVDGEVAITMAALPSGLIPKTVIDDRTAAEVAKSAAAQYLFFEDAEDVAFSYAASLQPLSASQASNGVMGIAENVTVVPRTPRDPDSGGRSERIVTIREPIDIEDALLRNGFDGPTAPAVIRTLANVFPSKTLPADAKLRILTGPSRLGPVPVPYRLSIYLHDRQSAEIQHAATAALTDRGTYVIAVAPAETKFPEEDTEVADVSALPSLYRSIWETARRHELDDETTTKVVALFAYETDLTQKVSPGDGIRLLTTRPDSGRTELLYAALTTGATTRELFRFQTEDGAVDFYSTDGETGKRFLTRRPLQGGGRLASRYGYRIHPIFKTRRLHTGTDLAAPQGTSIYAGGDGVVGKAGWTGGYGRYVEINHVNGYQPGYAHMSRIAKGLKPGDVVKQGQIIGYVGSTGNSTGNHLHYEIRINGRTADPLSAKLPRDKELSDQALPAFMQVTTQIRALMDRSPEEVSAL